MLNMKKRKEQQAEIWKQQSKCEYWGGEIGGVLTNKCKSCGEEIIN